METNLNTDNAPQKRGKLPIIIGLVVLLVAGGGLYSAYAMFDMFKSPKMVYLEAEKKSLDDLSQKMNDYNKQYTDYMKPYTEGAFEQNTEISNITADMAMDDPTVKQVLDILKDTKFVVQSKLDDKNGVNYNKLDVHIKGNNLIGAEVFYDKDKVGFGVPSVYKKYGYFNWKDKDLMETKYGMPGLPSRMVSSREYMDLLKIPNEEVQPIIQDYAKWYAENINEKQVTINKNGTFEQGETKLPAREITVSFTEPEYKAFVKKLTDKISKDEKIQNLLYPRYQKFMELAAISGQPEAKAMSKEEFKKQFQTFKEDADRSIDEADVSGGVKMVVYTDSDDNILKRTIHTENKKEGTKDALTFAHWSDKGNKENRVIEMTSKKDADNETNATITMANTEEGKTNKGNVVFSFKDKAFGTTSTDGSVNVDYTTTKEDNKQNADISFKIIADEGQGKTTPATGTIKATVTDNDKEKTRDIDYKLAVNLEANDPQIPKKLTMDVKSNEKFGIGSVKLPELNASNSINLATASNEEMMQVQQEIQMAFGEFMTKNMSFFQQLGIMPPTGMQ